MLDNQDSRHIKSTLRNIGFGRVMQLASTWWREDLSKMGIAGGEFVIGPCETETVVCSHPVLNKNGHCEVCAGCGWVTKYVHRITHKS